MGPPSSPCNFVPLFELPLENKKHPNFEWRGQGKGSGFLCFWSYPIWIQCLNNFVAYCSPQKQPVCPRSSPLKTFWRRGVRRDGCFRRLQRRIGSNTEQDTEVVKNVCAPFHHFTEGCEGKAYSDPPSQPTSKSDLILFVSTPPVFAWLKACPIPEWFPKPYYSELSKDVFGRLWTTTHIFPGALASDLKWRLKRL